MTAQDGTTTKTYTVNINRGVSGTFGWKAGEDLDGLIAAGNQAPNGAWSDGETIWVSDYSDKLRFTPTGCPTRLETPARTSTR